MMNRTRNVPCILLLALVLAGTSACKKDGSTSTGPGDEVIGTGAAQGAAMLDLVPADSPFVFASLAPITEEVEDMVARAFTPLVNILQASLAEARDEVTDPMGRAFLEEIDGKLSREGLASLGLSTRPRFAIYAIGWSLAIRVELADGKLLEDAIERIETRGGRAATRAQLGGVSYRHWGEDEGSFVLAIVGNEAVMGVMHKDARDKVLPVLFGQQKPDKSIRKDIQDAVAKYGLNGIMTMYLDTRAITRYFTGEASALTRDTQSLSEIELPPMSPECRQELTRLAEVLPRMVVGYKDISAKRYTALGAIELRPDVAKELAALRSPILDMPTLLQGEPLVAVGLGMDLSATVSWMGQKAVDMAREPYRCEYLSELNHGIAEAAEGLNQPLPPFVSGIKGGAVVLEELDVRGAMSTGKGYAVLNLDDPMSLVNMARMGVPQLANVQISPGQPVSVPVGMPGLDSVDVLVRDRWLGVAAGQGMIRALGSLLDAQPDPSKGSFAAFGYDYAAMMKKVGAFDNASPEEARIMEAMLGVAGYTNMELHFTEQGMLIESRGTFR